jgi:transposase InsO family protein
MQLAVDAQKAGEKQLIFVFDVHRIGHSIFGNADLRSILGDSNIPKVLHCCYGDAHALHREFGISLRGVFDTGLADCMLQGRQTQRSLDKVLETYLGAEAAPMRHKSKFEHIPRMFEPRPLSTKLFEYAYEDVVHCNRLHTVMAAELRERGILDLALALSAQRTPPFALETAHPRYQQATSVAIVVHDADYHICVQNEEGLCTVPTGHIPSESGDYKKVAADAWAEHMGGVPKALRAPLRCRMRKGIRIADTIVYMVPVDNCFAMLPALNELATLQLQANNHVVCRRNHSRGGPSTGVVQQQKLIAQYIQHTQGQAWDSRNQEATKGALQQQHTQLAGGAEVADVNVVVGRTTELHARAAIIVRDETTTYCLTTSKGGVLQFPSHPVEVGYPARDAAVKAFDVYGGVALRKGAPRSAGGLAVMPETARRIGLGFKELRSIGVFGNTTFFEAFVPELADLRASFTAARKDVNGYRLTKTLENRHPDYSLCPLEHAAAALAPEDAAALQSAILNSGGGAVSQHSGTQVATMEAGAELSTFAFLTGEETGGRERGSQTSQASGPLGPEAELVHIDTSLHMQREATGSPSADHADQSQYMAVGPQMPPVGSDPEYDVLFEAAVLLNYASLVEAGEKSTAACAVLPHGSVGEPPKLAMPSREEVIKAQRQHPATSSVYDFLENGELSKAWELVVAYREEREFAEKVKHYHLSDSGLLLYSPPTRKGRRADGRIVLPPQFRNHILHHFHDRLGHFGVGKTAEMIERRFYWPGLRKTVAEHIRKCEPCQRSKIPGIRAGEMQIPDTGRHPGDVLVGDHYYVGIEEDGYDSTLDFACCFTRGVRSTAMKGVPSSEQIIDVLLRDHIRRSGVPSEVRTDAASSFISKAVRELYDRMGIQMIVGTAYHHQLVGLVERWHRTLKQLMITLKASKDSRYEVKWYRCLAVLELAYNQTVNKATGYSPFFLEHLRHPRLPFEFDGSRPTDLPASLPDWVQDRLDELEVTYDAAARSLRLNALSAKRKYDLRRDTQAYFKPGDRVLLIQGTAFDHNAVHPKATLPTTGPYTVSRVLSHDRYVLSDLETRRIRNTVHVSRLRPYHRHTVEAGSTWMVGTQDGSGRWPVHSVVARRFTKLAHADQAAGLDKGERVLQYKIRWVGFDQSHDRWIPVHYLSEIRGLLNCFDARHPTKDDISIPTPEEVIDRPSAVASPTDQPKQNPTFQTRMHAGPKPPAADRPEISPEAGAVVEPAMEDAIEADERAEQEREDYRSLQQLKEGTRVRVLCKRTRQLRTGEVVRSWLTRWSTAGKRMHMVRVQYDDTDNNGERFGQFNATEVDVEGAVDEQSNEQTVTTQDDKALRRQARIQRELS